MRKIIQIAFDPSSDFTDGTGGSQGDMYALCNDGTVWDWSLKTYTWKYQRRMSDIPQHEIEPLKPPTIEPEGFNNP